jgi:hypothetical protein
VIGASASSLEALWEIIPAVYHWPVRRTLAFQRLACGGALWEIVGGALLRYRCHPGHACSAAAMRAAAVRSRAAGPSMSAVFRTMHYRDCSRRGQRDTSNMLR